MVLQEAASHSSIIRVTRYVSRRSPVSCFHAKTSWIRTLVNAAIARSGECVTALHGAARGGSKYLELMNSLEFPYGTCFIMDIIVFHESSMEWDSVPVN